MEYLDEIISMRVKPKDRIRDENGTVGDWIRLQKIE